MKVVYYKHIRDNVIGNHQILPEEWSDAEIEEKRKRYNEKNGNIVQASVVDVEEGSFMAYLLERADQRRKFPKEAIQEALDALDEARAAIWSLEVEDEESKLH